MLSRLSDLALPYMAKKLLKPFMGVRTSDLDLLEKNQNAILVLQKATWIKILLLLSVAPKIHLILPEIEKRRFPWFNWMFYSVHVIPTDSTYETVVDTAKTLSSNAVSPCIVVNSDTLPKTLQPASLLASFFKLTPTELIFVDIDRSGVGTLITFSKK